MLWRKVETVERVRERAPRGPRAARLTKVCGGVRPQRSKVAITQPSRREKNAIKLINERAQCGSCVIILSGGKAQGREFLTNAAQRLTCLSPWRRGVAGAPYKNLGS